MSDPVDNENVFETGNEGAEDPFDVAVRLYTQNMNEGQEGDRRAAPPQDQAPRRVPPRDPGAAARLPPVMEAGAVDEVAREIAREIAREFNAQAEAPPQDQPPADADAQAVAGGEDNQCCR